MKKSSDLFFNFALLAFYLFAVILAINNHELWGDEVHSWNIVKGSHSLNELFQNIRYEGHPPFWYCYLFPFTRFSHSLNFLQAAQFVFVALSAFLLIFFSPFNKLQKVLLLCGYYFVFEYAVLARNYMPAVFFAFCIASIYYREFRWKTVCYYILLLALANVHLIGLLLAVSIHAAYIHDRFRAKLNIAFPVFYGAIIFTCAFYFIFPPGDSQLNIQFWMENWSFSRLYLFVTVIVKSLFPFQEWFNQHWWNTSLLLDNDSMLFRLFSILIFGALLGLIYFGVRKDKTALLILSVNLGLTFVISLVFPLNTARYTGFVFIGFVIAAWFSFRDKTISFNRNVFLIIALLQIPPGFFAIVMDGKQKFSSASLVVDIYKQIPEGSFVATDYWSLNYLSAHLDTSFYCIELERTISFLTWNSEMKAVGRFNCAEALEKLMTWNMDQPYYYYSMKRLPLVLPESRKIRLLPSGDTGFSIERSSRVYLYKVERI